MTGARAMSPASSIGLAQLNSHLGNVSANVSRLLESRRQAAAVGAGIIVTPEMYLSGYPCDDLVLRSDFMGEVASGLQALAEATADGGPAIIVGAPHVEDGVITNSVFVVDEGSVQARRDKVELPNYGVFDDKRNFTAGAMPGPVMVRGRRLGLPICEGIGSVAASVWAITLAMSMDRLPQMLSRHWRPLGARGVLVVTEWGNA